MSQEEQIDIYTIPPNFAEEGTMLSGWIKTRNAVETAVILMILIPVLLALDCSVKAKMYIGMIGIVPIVILAVIGVQGESLFAFIASFFRYLGRRRCLAVPDDRYRMEQSRRREKGKKGELNRGKKQKKRKRQAEKAGKPDMETGAAADQAETETGTAKRNEGKKVLSKGRKKLS